MSSVKFFQGNWAVRVAFARSLSVCHRLKRFYHRPRQRNRIAWLANHYWVVRCAPVKLL